MREEQEERRRKFLKLRLPPRGAHFYRWLYLEVKARRRRSKNVLPTSTKQPLLPFILERFISRQNVKRRARCQNARESACVCGVLRRGEEEEEEGGKARWPGWNIGREKAGWTSIWEISRAVFSDELTANSGEVFPSEEFAAAW